MSQKVYDLVIAGAGITGLYVATHYLEKYPTHSVKIIEKNKYVGGRIYTHRPYIPGKGRYQWEAGAGRIPLTHRRVIGLIKKYGLTFQRWATPSNLEDPFPDLVPIYLKPLQSLPAHVLGQHTLATLLQKIHGPTVTKHFIKKFPYWAEFHTLRADLALDAFLLGPLGGQQKIGWGGCAEGLSMIVERMAEHVRSRGGEIQLYTSVLQVDPESKSIQILSHEMGNKKQYIYAKNIVMALDADSLRNVKGITKYISALGRLKSEPLLRIYAVFPTHHKEAWFSGMAKQVFPNSPIRFFIPMNASNGLVMISYTEGHDTEEWMKMSESQRKQQLMMELRRIFPEKKVPDPITISFHYWKSGCTYWLPGSYDPYQLSRQSVQPNPLYSLYFCNESFAVQQSWIESGLEQGDHVIKQLLK